MSLKATLEELKWRGLINDITDEDGICKLTSRESVYQGIDPTAPSPHIGNLVPIIMLIHLARAGLKPIFLFGGSTGAIGDPSGKSNERQLLEQSIIEKNIANQSELITVILDRLKIKPKFVNNYDWTKDISYLDFLRDVGKHFSVNYMIAKETVKTRIEGSGISYTEFSYMLLQSFDFYHLYTKENCRLQLGGSDQWGNITAGLELIRRKAQGEAYAMSTPLVLDSQGKKFGKSEAGAVWLDAKLLSPYKFHQFWLNVSDSDVVRYLKIFTFLSKSEIETLEKNLSSAPEKREAQNRLADEMCNLIHGEKATQFARRSAAVLFGGSLDGFSGKELSEIFADVPSSTIPREKLTQLSYVEILTESGLVKSKGEARRLIESGGAYLNNQRVSDSNLKMAESGQIGSEIILLRSGKKSYHLLKIAN